MGDTQPRRLEERLVYELLLMIGLMILALGQVTLLPAPLGFPPALVLVVVVNRTLIGVSSSQPDHNTITSLRWAIYGGLALDVCSATPIGSHVLALTLAAMIIAAATRRLRIEGLFIPLSAVLVGILIYECTLALVYHITVTPLDWPAYAQVAILPSVSMALILSLPTFSLMRWLDLRMKK